MPPIRSAIETICYDDKVSDDIARENFEIDIESWLYAIRHSKAKFDSEIVHALLREMSGSFSEAIKSSIVFDLVGLAEKLFNATGKVVCQKEIVFYLLANLPNPAPLNDQQFNTFEEIVAKSKIKYPEIVSKFEARIAAARAQLKS